MCPRKAWQEKKKGDKVGLKWERCFVLDVPAVVSVVDVENRLADENKRDREGVYTRWLAFGECAVVGSLLLELQFVLVGFLLFVCMCVNVCECMCVVCVCVCVWIIDCSSAVPITGGGSEAGQNRARVRVKRKVVYCLACE